MCKTNKKNLVNYQAEASCPPAWGLTTSEIRWDLPTNIVITLPGGTWKQNRKSSISVPLPLAHGIKFQKFHQIFEECKMDVQSCSNPEYETINLNCYFQPSLPIISQDRVTFLQPEDWSCLARERDVALVRSRMKRSVWRASLNSPYSRNWIKLSTTVLSVYCHQLKVSLHNIYR